MFAAGTRSLILMPNHLEPIAGASHASTASGGHAIGRSGPGGRRESIAPWYRSEAPAQGLRTGWASDRYQRAPSAGVWRGYVEGRLAVGRRPLASAPEDVIQSMET